MSGNGGNGRRRAGGRPPYRRRAGANQPNKPSWTSKHPVLKNDVFNTGTAESAAKFVESLKAIIAFTRADKDERESHLIAQALENEAIPHIPPPLPPPQIPDPNNAGVMIDDAAENAIWNEEIKMIAKRRQSLQDGLRRTFALLLNQCDTTVLRRLKGEDGWEQVEQDRNPVVLVQRLRRVCCGFDTHKQPIYALVQAIKMLCTHMQKGGESNEKYKERLEALFNIIEQFGGSLTAHPVLIERRAQELAGEGNLIDADDRAEAAIQIEAEVKAAFLLSGANDRKYGALKVHLENTYSLGDDRYPRDVEQALGQLNNFRAPTQPRHNQPRNDPTGPGNEEDGLQCLQQGESERTEGDDTKDGAVMAQSKERSTAPKENSKGESGCFHCGKTDHWIMDCPELSEAKKGQLFLQLDGAMVSQFQDREEQRTKSGGLRRNWLCLDTCTTDNQVVEEKYLYDVEEVEVPLRLHTNAGTSVSRKRGMMGSLRFWLNPDGIANVVALRALEEKYRVHYDSEAENRAFVVMVPNGPLRFERCPDTGFPYIDLDELSAEHRAMLMQTVRGNYEGFTKREIARAKEARELQGRIGHPSDKDFNKLLKDKDNVSQSLLHDCPTTLTDVSNAKTIYGPSLPRMKGTSVRTKPVRAEPEYVRIPREIVEMNRYVTLVGDVLFVCGLPFLISMSRRIRFVTLEFVPRRTAKELTNGFKNILNLYKRAGFIAQCALMDNEFEPLKGPLLDTIEINTTAKNEHVGEIERKIRHVKERVRCVKSTLPYRHKALPHAIIKAMLSHVVLWMNAFVSDQGVSEVFSPREIVLRRQLKWKLHARANFGSYCEAYDEPDPNETNTQAERTIACINLGPTGNIQGTHRFLNLETGRVIKRKTFKEMPMPDDVIERVHYWGLKDKQQANNFTFRNRNNEDFAWDDDPLVSDNAIEPEIAPFPDLPAVLPGIELERDQPTPAVVPDTDPVDDPAGIDFAARAAAAANANFAPNLVPPEIAEDDRSDMPPQQPIQNNIVYNLQVNRIEPDDNNDQIEQQDDDDIDDPTYNPDTDVDDGEDDSLDLDDYEDARSAEEEPEEPPRRSDRDRRAPTYFHDEYNFLQQRGRWTEADEMEKTLVDENVSCEVEEPIELQPGEELVFGAIMAQLSLKQGLKKWGQRGADSAMKEMRQMHDLQAFFPRDPKTMTKQQRIQALSSLIFLKEKANGEIKSRTCINGAPQRKYIKKEDAASPTVSTDGVFIVNAINAYEERDVATMDLPGAFLNTLTDELVFMVLKGELCELMVKVDPKIYRRYMLLRIRRELPFCMYNSTSRCMVCSGRRYYSTESCEVSSKHMVLLSTPMTRVSPIKRQRAGTIAYGIVARGRSGILARG